MQIEKWILAEMLAGLVKLKNKKHLDAVEGERKYYPTRREHCDLWWKVEGKQHWLEVKTIVVNSLISWFMFSTIASRSVHFVPNH